MAKLNKKIRPQVPLQLQEGYIIAQEFSASGGVSYEREDLREDLADDKSLEAEFKTLKRVDNVDLHKESQAIMNAAYYSLERICTHTPIGFFADSDQLVKLNEAIEDVKETAATFNELSRRLGSARRVTVEIYPLVLDLASEAAAKRLARTVREKLGEAMSCLRNADRKGFEAAWGKMRNLDKLAVGIQADSVRLAMECLKEQKAEWLGKIREGADPTEEAKRLSLEPVEAAIGLFNTED